MIKNDKESRQQLSTRYNYYTQKIKDKRQRLKMNNILMYSSYKLKENAKFENAMANQIIHDKIVLDYLNEHNIRFEMSEAKFRANISKILNLFNVVEGLIMTLKYVDTRTRKITKATVLAKGDPVKTFQSYDEALKYVATLNHYMADSTDNDIQMCISNGEIKCLVGRRK